MRSKKGQSMVETALMIPIIMLVLFGIVDFGRMLHALLTLDHAGREAARLASIHADDSAIINKVKSSAAILELSDGDITITPPAASRTTGNDVVITLKYDFNFITPLADTIASPMELTDRTVMRME